MSNEMQAKRSFVTSMNMQCTSPSTLTWNILHQIFECTCLNGLDVVELSGWVVVHNSYQGRSLHVVTHKEYSCSHARVFACGMHFSAEHESQLLNVPVRTSAWRSTNITTTHTSASISFFLCRLIILHGIRRTLKFFDGGIYAKKCPLWKLWEWTLYKTSLFLLLSSDPVMIPIVTIGLPALVF